MIRKGKTGGGGCTPRVQIAWPCLGSGIERSWLAVGVPFLSFVHHSQDVFRDDLRMRLHFVGACVSISLASKPSAALNCFLSLILDL